MHVWIDRLLGSFRKRQLESRLNDELQFHLDMRTQEFIASGMMPEEARQQAARLFGNRMLFKEKVREMDTIGWIETIWQDLRYGLRMLGKSPGFSSVAVLSLALGIGANTAIFSMLDAILWKQLPVVNPAHLVNIQTIEGGSGRVRGIPPSLLRDLQLHGQVFSGMLAGIPDGLAFSAGDRTERVIGEVVTANYFSVLGIKPYLGHYFTAGADGAAWQPVAVLSYDFFQRRFGADPAIVGRRIYLNGYPFTVIGVSPPGFFGLEVGTSWEVRIPMMLEPKMQARLMPAMELLDPRNEHFVTPVARLKTGVTREQAEAATEIVFQQLFASDPEDSAGRHYGRLHIRLKDASGESPLLRQFKRPLLILTVVVGLVLLIACANIASLLLARAAARQREIALRLAIGASRSRIVRQLLTESLLLAGMGGVLGMLFGYWGAHTLLTFMPQGNIGIILELRPDARVLGFTMAVSMLTGILFGLAPALQVARADLILALKRDTATPGGTRPRSLLAHTTTIAEVALALVLTVGAGLFIRSLSKLKAVDLGYQPDQIVMFSTKPVQDGHARYTDAQLRNLFRELVRRVEVLPGVAGASMTADGILNGWARSLKIQREDQTGITVELTGDQASPGFFSTVGIALLRGRTFTDADSEQPFAVVIIGDTLARDLFGSENPVGRKIKIGTSPRATHMEIVGVVRTVRYGSVRRPETRLHFTPFGQGGIPTFCTLLIRTSVPNVTGLVAAIQREFQVLDKNLPLFNIRTATMQIDRELVQERLVGILSGLFGGLSLFLVGIGLYGVIAYSVTKRAKEIGIRMALGAERRSVLWLVLRDTLRLVLAGMVVGLPIVFVLARLVAGELYGITPFDPLVVGGSLVVVIGVGVVAGLLPARRAATVDPMVTLRHE